MQSRFFMLGVARLFEIFPAIYEAKNFITVFAKPATVPCSGQDSSTARISMLYLFKIKFNISLPTHVYTSPPKPCVHFFPLRCVLRDLSISFFLILFW
jgi:hypothetical protein